MTSNASQLEQTSAASAEVGQPAPLWATLIATFFGAGRLKPGPGTWGSLATVIAWVAIARGLPASWVVPANVALAALAVAVIDETAGQLITLLGAPLAWKSLLAGFILFRAFDIVKPYPIRQLEKLPEGSGIVIDDVAAGLYGLAVMQLLLHFGLLGH